MDNYFLDTQYRWEILTIIYQIISAFLDSSRQDVVVEVGLAREIVIRKLLLVT